MQAFLSVVTQPTKLARKMKFVSGQVEYVTEEGTKPYIPIDIKGSRDAYAASLHLLFNHVAQFHVQMLEILSDKYKIPVDEMLKVVKEDPRYVQQISCPVVQTMGYFEEPPSSAVDKLASTFKNSMTVEDTETLPEPPKLKRKRTVKPPVLKESSSMS
jgi:hypothetical protein